MLSSPNPPPPDHEIVPSTTIDVNGLRKYRLTLGHVRLQSNGPFLLINKYQVFQTLAATAEVVAIIANIRPQSKLSRAALSICVRQGMSASKLRMTPLSSLGAVLWVCGAALRLRTFHELGRFFRFEISIQENHKLIVTGPYAYVRHPAYSGMLLANIGWFLWNGASGSWVKECGFFASPASKLCLAVYTAIAILSTSVIPFSRMSKEDEVLKREFGGQWDDWARRVRYSVIPGVY